MNVFVTYSTSILFTVYNLVMDSNVGTQDPATSVTQVINTYSSFLYVATLPTHVFVTPFLPACHNVSRFVASLLVPL